MSVPIMNKICLNLIAILSVNIFLVANLIAAEPENESKTFSPEVIQIATATQLKTTEETTKIETESDEEEDDEPDCD